MPRPNIIVGVYPDVPRVRGVPQLVRSPTAEQIRALAIATAAIRGRLWRSSVEFRWGIFDAENNAVVEPDSILALDHRSETRISDYPVQAGAFASYNKVAMPHDLAVRLSKGGSLEDRARFLEQIEAVHRSLDLYTVVTPERAYLGVNLVRYEVTRRGPQGAYFLTEVDVFFREVRQVAAQYSLAVSSTRNAQEAAARPFVNQGIVQPAPVPDGVSVDD